MYSRAILKITMHTYISMACKFPPFNYICTEFLDIKKNHGFILTCV